MPCHNRSDQSTQRATQRASTSGRRASTRRPCGRASSPSRTRVSAWAPPHLSRLPPALPPPPPLMHMPTCLPPALRPHLSRLRLLRLLLNPHSHAIRQQASRWARHAPSPPRAWSGSHAYSVLCVKARGRPALAVNMLAPSHPMPANALVYARHLRSCTTRPWGSSARSRDFFAASAAAAPASEQEGQEEDDDVIVVVDGKGAGGKGQHSRRSQGAAAELALTRWAACCASCGSATPGAPRSGRAGR